MGESLGASLLQKGWRVYATTRCLRNLQKFKNLGFFPLLFLDESFDFQRHNITHVLSTIPRKEALLDPGLNFMKRHKFPNLRWIGYLSSTSVYGDHAGVLVDEESLCKSESLEGIARKKSEDEWQQYAQDNNSPLIIFRLAGIYGPYQNALKSIKEGKSHFIQKDGHFISRIHIDDIVDVLFQLFSLKEGVHIFNGADNAPSSVEEVIRYACALMKVPVPCFKKFEDVRATLSPFLQRLFEENRRISNKKMKKFTQRPLIFPSYKEGLFDIFMKGAW